MEAVGGAERVVRAVLKINKGVDLFCLWSDESDQELKDIRKEESWLSKTPLSGKKGLALPLMPLTWKLANFKSNPDWVFVSSHLFAHHVSLNKSLRDIPGINYIHSPARYIWNPELDDRANSFFVKPALPALRLIDRARAKSSNFKFMANSQNVQQRIYESWGIDSEILYPPVRVKALREIAHGFSPEGVKTKRYTQLGLPSEYLIGVGRFIPYKRLDQVIRTAASLKLPAVLIGSGDLEKSYRQLAAELGVRLFILSGLSDRQVAEIIYLSQALIFAGVEDFGIVPVEAMALGVPVIALGQGGACETVEHGVGGFLIQDFDKDDLADVVSKATNLPKTNITQSVLKFDEAEFSKKTRKLIEAIV
jgi:glycosyltransferase involved in cell wall biosynthesis